MHKDIDEYTFHQSDVAQWQRVWPQIMRSAVRITGKPMVLKVRRKIGRSWSCDQCHMWSWAFDGRLVFSEDELGTRYLIMSFSVDSCVRKHAKVYGENRQPCFNLTEVDPHVQCLGPNSWLPVRPFSYVRSWSDTRQSAASTCNQVSPAEWMGWRDGRAGKYPLYFHRFTFILHSYYPWLKLQESRLAVNRLLCLILWF